MPDYKPLFSPNGPIETRTLNSMYATQHLNTRAWQTAVLHKRAFCDIRTRAHYNTNEEGK